MDDLRVFLETVEPVVRRLECERSEPVATELARLLGYIVQREQEVIWVDRPAWACFLLYFQVSEFVEDILADGKAVVAACGGSCL